MALGLRHDSVVKGKRGRKPRQTVGSQPDSKKDRQGGREGGLGRLSPPPSCGLAVILLLQPEPAEIRTFLRKRGKPVQAEMAQANVMLGGQKAFH